MGVDKPHLVPVSLCDAGDQIFDMAEGGTDGGAGFARSEPGVDLELALSGLLVGDQIEVEIEVLEVPHQLASRSFDLDDLRVNIDFDTFRDVHGFRRENGLHLCSLSLSSHSLSLFRSRLGNENAVGGLKTLAARRLIYTSGFGALIGAWVLRAELCH